MFLSLLLPLGVGVVTRLSLRTRGQGQNNLTINLPLWILAIMWPVFSLIPMGLLAGPIGQRPEVAGAMVIAASVAGLLIPEIFRGIGAATTAALSRPRNWFVGGVVGIVLYGLLFDSQTLGWLLTLGVMWVGYRMILGMLKPPKKGGG